jgi:ATP-binding cassette subfamily B protein RaxB
MSKRTLPVITQVEFSECGHACVAMLANYYGHDIDLLALRHRKQPSLTGSSLSDIIELLEQLKLHARAFRIAINELQKVQCPAILHWNANHFVLLKHINRKFAIIHDPQSGKRRITLEELAHCFTGIVVEVEQAPDFSCLKEKTKLSFSDLFHGVHGLKKSLFLLLLLSLVIEIFVLLNPLFLQYITDNVANTHSFNNLYVIAGGFILLTFCHTTIEFMRSHFVVFMKNHLSEYFSSSIMNHLLSVPFNYFECRHKGDILSRFHSIHDIQTAVTTESINALLDGLVILLSVFIMFFYNLQLTFFVLLSLVLYLGIRMLCYRHHKNQTQKSISEQAALSSKFLEILHNILPIKLYGKEKTMYRVWKNSLIQVMNAEVQIARVQIMYTTSTLFLFNIEHIMVAVLGSVLVLHNQFSAGMFIAFLAYRQTLVTKSTSFIQKFFDYKLISVQLERISDLLLQPSEKVEGRITIQKNIRGSIKARNLGFQYPGSSNWVLRNLTFDIQQGEKIAITGPSGIGKTTLLKIMLGLIKPTEGEIWVDDVSLNLLGLQQYRAICACVLQDNGLISGTILDNIVFLDTRIDLDKVYEVAEMAQIHQDVLKMKMNYETLIGEMGAALSGGQKQRILIARALYRNPKILFLDEATSHLDLDAEVKINQALRTLNITQIIIAHREESIKMADRVITLG